VKKRPIIVGLRRRTFSKKHADKIRSTTKLNPAFVNCTNVHRSAIVNIVLLPGTANLAVDFGALCRTAHGGPTDGKALQEVQPAQPKAV
jgi:hypothetical protein